MYSNMYVCMYILYLYIIKEFTARGSEYLHFYLLLKTHRSQSVAARDS